MREEKDRLQNADAFAAITGPRTVAIARAAGVSLITFKMEIHSLGVIFTEILTGQKGPSPVDDVRKKCPICGLLHA
jgi:hypothetical protein